MTPLGPTRIATLDAHGASLSLPDGAQFQLDVLEPSLVRVRHRPAAGYREPRTWAIAPPSAAAATAPAPAVRLRHRPPAPSSCPSHS